MKIMIGYATKSGAARECAELLRREFPEAQVFDLNKDAVNPDDFDVIIIGSGVRIGKLYKPVRKFLKDNHSILLRKKVAYYVCNGEPDTAQEIIDKNFPQDIIASAITIDSFGGYPPFAKGDAKTGIRTDSVMAFVQKVKQAI